jgi:hypothetical protein
MLNMLKARGMLLISAVLVGVCSMATTASAADYVPTLGRWTATLAQVRRCAPMEAKAVKRLSTEFIGKITGRLKPARPGHTAATG